MSEDPKKDNNSDIIGGESNDDVLSTKMRKKVEQAKQKSVDELLTSMSPAQKKDRKKIYLTAAALCVVSLLAMSAAAFAFWYQNPSNAVTDSFAKALSAKTISAKSHLTYQGMVDAKITSGFGHDKGYTASAEVKLGGGGNVSSDSIVKGELRGNADGDTYFKVSNVERLIDALVQQSTIALRLLGFSDDTLSLQKKILGNVYNNLGKELDDKWILYSNSAIAKPDDAVKAREYQCVVKVLQKVHNDPVFLANIGVAYNNNRLIKVVDELEAKDGQKGYRIEFDQKAAQNFVTEFEKTEVFKYLKECSGDTVSSKKLGLSDLGTKRSPLSDMVFEIWIDEWSHELKTLAVRDGFGFLKVTTDFEFNKKVDVQLPSEYMSYSKVQDQIEYVLSLFKSNPLSKRPLH